MNSQHLNINSRGDFVLQKLFINVCFKDFWYIKVDMTQIWYMINSIDTHLRLKSPPYVCINYISHSKSEQNYILLLYIE